MWTTDIMAGNSIVGAGGGTDGIETQDEANFVTATDNQGVLDLWRGPWPGILRCNIVLQKVPEMAISDNIKNRVLGEAYFLRAHYYFILVQFFGDVPLTLKSVEPGDDRSCTDARNDNSKQTLGQPSLTAAKFSGLLFAGHDGVVKALQEAAEAGPILALRQP